MKIIVAGIGPLAVMALLASPVYAQTPGTVKVIGCLQGDGSEQKPWFISGVAIPAPAPAPAAGGGGRGGAAAGAGGAAGGGAPAGAAPPGGAAAGGGGRGGGGAGGAAGGGGRGGGGRGGAAAAPVPPPAPVPLVDLRLTGGMDMSAWRGMKIEVEGALGPKPGTGLQDINITSARSVQGVCIPK